MCVKKELHVVLEGVFIMPYKLPPNKCLKQKFILLTLVISGPKYPNNNQYVFASAIQRNKRTMAMGICI
jgi:hypothetical protein